MEIPPQVVEENSTRLSFARSQCHATTATVQLFALGEYDPDRVIPPHRHARAHCTYVVAGSYREYGDQSGWRICRQGDILFHAARDIHANRIGAEGARCLNIELCDADPLRRAFSVAAIRGAAMGQLPAEQSNRYGRALSALVVGITIGERRAPAGRRLANIAGSLYRELEASLWRIALTRSPRWLAPCIEEVRRHPGDPHPLEQLAALGGVHPHASGTCLSPFSWPDRWRMPAGAAGDTSEGAPF